MRVHVVDGADQHVVELLGGVRLTFGSREDLDKVILCLLRKRNEQAFLVAEPAINGCAARGGTVLVSSHVLAELAQTVYDVVIMSQGHIVASGPLAQLAGDGWTLEDLYLKLTEGETP